MGPGDLCRVPPATVHHGRARQSSGTGPCGYCRRVLWVPGPAGQYSGKIRFIEKPGIQDEGGRHVDKRISDPRVAQPEVKVQVRDLVRVLGIVAPFAPRGFSIRGKFVLQQPYEFSPNCWIWLDSMANERLIFLACNIYSTCILAEYSRHSCTFRWVLWPMGLWFQNVTLGGMPLDYPLHPGKAVYLVRSRLRFQCSLLPSSAIHFQMEMTRIYDFWLFMKSN